MPLGDYPRLYPDQRSNSRDHGTRSHSLHESAFALQELVFQSEPAQSPCTGTSAKYPYPHAPTRRTQNVVSNTKLCGVKCLR